MNYIKTMYSFKSKITTLFGLINTNILVNSGILLERERERERDAGYFSGLLYI